MKPLNRSDKKKAVRNFIAIYILSMLALFLSSFFIFSSPAKIQSNEVKSYDDFKAQHTSLINRASEITSQISELIEVEKGIYTDSNSSLDSMVAEYRKRIDKIMASLKEDSANNSLPMVGKNLNDYLVAYNAVLFYSQDNYNLRKVLSTTSKGSSVDYAGQILKLQREKEQLQTENTTLKSKTIIPQKDKEVPAIKANENTTTKTAESQQIRNLTSQNLELTSKNQDLKTSLAQAEKDRDNCKTQLATSKNDSKPVNNAPAQTVNVCSEEDQAKLLFQNADLIVKRSQSEKNKDQIKGMCMAAQTILMRIQNTYPDKAQLNQKLGEIRKILSKDTNF